MLMFIPRPLLHRIFFAGDFGALVTAVERLTLNDASVTVERESSTSLGLGLRCGFLGLLHMDVFVSRLQSEFETPVIITAPMVAYQLKLEGGDGKIVTVERPGDFPPAHQVSSIDIICGGKGRHSLCYLSSEIP